ncbi:MAG: TIGR04283 family arsenosugar biosynthesis glycosyltransferase [Pseudomonadota bacterium]|nr:MAG: TIGR04283 family arsenosugar biosynthesis glycosyltransferase [Pseudomonadota bacterium]
MHGGSRQQLWRCPQLVTPRTLVIAVNRNARISVVIPALNEGEHIKTTLRSLAPLRAAGHEVILVDGRSEDATVTLARTLADHVFVAPRGRARQMIEGARMAQGEILWFLHADTQVPEEAHHLILDALTGTGVSWGHFAVRLTGRQGMLRVVERMMNLRSRMSGIATGDQGIFVARSAYDNAGGISDIPLMEDVELSRRLKRHSRPACVRVPLRTSSRRWEEGGVLRTIVLMWRLRLAYALGADPGRLARHYR